MVLVGLLREFNPPPQHTHTHTHTFIVCKLSDSINHQGMVEYSLIDARYL